MPAENRNAKDGEAELTEYLSRCRPGTTRDEAMRDLGMVVPPMPPDRPTCATCRWWDAWYAGSAKGACRVNPPNFSESDEGEPIAAWPISRSDDWCGEHATVHSPVVCADHPDRPGYSTLYGIWACADCVLDAMDEKTAGKFLRGWRERRFHAPVAPAKESHDAR